MLQYESFIMLNEQRQSQKKKNNKKNSTHFIRFCVHETLRIDKPIQKGALLRLRRNEGWGKGCERDN